MVGITRRLFLATALAAPALHAQQPARDTLVKAAFLHKFASFVTWPDGAFPRPESPLRIGVYGDEQVWRDLLDLARDRDRDGRQVFATRLLPGSELAGFHILYLKGSAARIADLLAQVPEGVLTVADSDGAHPPGSVLSFFMDEGRVGFGVSLDAAARQGLRLSPRLVAAARKVSRAKGPRDFA